MSHPRRGIVKIACSSQFCSIVAQDTSELESRRSSWASTSGEWSALLFPLSRFDRVTMRFQPRWEQSRADAASERKMIFYEWLAWRVRLQLLWMKMFLPACLGASDAGGGNLFWLQSQSEQTADVALSHPAELITKLASDFALCYQFFGGFHERSRRNPGRQGKHSPTESIASRQCCDRKNVFSRLEVGFIFRSTRESFGAKCQWTFFVFLSQTWQQQASSDFSIHKSKWNWAKTATFRADYVIQTTSLCGVSYLIALIVKPEKWSQSILMMSLASSLNWLLIESSKLLKCSCKWIIHRHCAVWNPKTHEGFPILGSFCMQIAWTWESLDILIILSDCSGVDCDFNCPVVTWSDGCILQTLGCSSSDLLYCDSLVELDGRLE